jgi:hypothetical protein
MVRISDLVANSDMLDEHELDAATKESVMDFVTKYQDEFPELSLRTVLKIADLAKAYPDSWEKKALMTVVGQ